MSRLSEALYSRRLVDRRLEDSVSLVAPTTDSCNWSVDRVIVFQCPTDLSLRASHLLASDVLGVLPEFRSRGVA